MQKQSLYSRQISIIIHILVWVVLGLVIFYYQPFFSDLTIPYQFWIRQTVKLTLLATAFYINLYVLVPKLLLRNRTVYYFLILAGIVAVIVVINAWVERALHLDRLFAATFHKEDQTSGAKIPMLPNADRPFWRISLSDALIITISALVLGISTSMGVIQKWQKDKQKREELEKDKITSELTILKAQINPHFFFNTLNNIYALTAVDGELAGKAIHQLSRMMRYLLYDTQAGLTMLSQEIAFVKDYISLMQLRLTDAVTINIDTPLNLKDVPLAPMIFLPFVENAFKHGVRSSQSGHISINILQENKMLELVVKNSVIKDNSLSLDTGSGIGLVNTKRRLDLLYPSKHKLDIHELNADNEYTVHLLLNLS